MTKVFDFNHPDFKEHLPDYQEYLLKNHDKPVTEDEFVAFWVKRPRVKTDGTPILHAAHKRSPSNARHIYRHLLTYGVFQEGHK